jgi:hypothetical protein
MERGNPPADGEQQPRIMSGAPARSWRDAVRRGAIIGGVVGAHVVLLMLVLHPWWRPLAPVARQRDTSVLRLSFDRLAPAAVMATVAARRLPDMAKRARRPVALPSQRRSSVVATATHPGTAPADALIATAPPIAPGAEHGYQPGTFEAILQDAQRTRPDHLPGSDAPVVGGIRFQARSSAKAMVRALAQGNRCANMAFQLRDSAHQLAPSMIDHALEVEGCGPHLERTPLDSTIDAITQQATAAH